MWSVHEVSPLTPTPPTFTPPDWYRAKPAAEYVYTADAVPDQGITRGAKQNCESPS